MRFGISISMITPLLLVACVASSAQSQQPTPGIGKKEQRPAAHQPKQTETQTTPRERGTETNPLVVKPMRGQDQADEDRADRMDQQANRRQTFWLSVVTLLVLGFQVVLLVMQNRIIRGQSQIMETQAKHMEDGLKETRASISEATKSADAMARIASAIEIQRASLDTSIALQRSMAEIQKTVMILQNRAYLDVSDWKVFRVIDEFPDEAHLISPNNAAVRFSLHNKGQTAAHLHAIRESADTIKFERKTALDVILEPGKWLQRGFPFSLPQSTGDEVEIFYQPFVVGIEVNYSDGFATRTKRFGRMTWSHTDALTTGEKKDTQEWLMTGGSAMNGEIEHPVDTQDAEGKGQPKNQP